MAEHTNKQKQGDLYWNVTERAKLPWRDVRVLSFDVCTVNSTVSESKNNKQND